jgi:hypothetical protein
MVVNSPIGKESPTGTAVTYVETTVLNKISTVAINLFKLETFLSLFYQSPESNLGSHKTNSGKIISRRILI